MVREIITGMAGVTYACPGCEGALVQARLEPGASWACPTCGGMAVTMAVFRQHTHPSLATRLWTQARDHNQPSMRRCAACRLMLVTFEVEEAEGAVELDACLRCHLLWFDATELASLGVTLRPAKAAQLSQPAAIAHSRLLADLHRAGEEAKAQTTAAAVAMLESRYWWTDWTDW